MAANVPPAAAVPPIPPPAGAVPPVPPVVPVVPVAAPFSLAPGLATTTVLDYMAPEASKLFVRSTKPLTQTPYNCEPEHIKYFLECLSECSRTIKAGNNLVTVVPPGTSGCPTQMPRHLLCYLSDIFQMSRVNDLLN